MADGFLGVSRSVGGRFWRSRLTDERAALALSQQLDLPEVVGRVLAARGVGLDEGEKFLNPKIRASLPDPSHLLDMDKAADRLAAAVMAGEGIAVFGDYDVDGATSAALLRRFFRAAGSDLEVYIPDRKAEGYGPNLPALLRLRDAGAGVVVTVDCGTSAFEPLAAAAEAGLDVIVVDHHVAEAGLPVTFALVNPNRFDETSGCSHLAAVGVAFLLVVAVNRRLREAGWYEDRPEPDPLAWLDLVALGTVCDAVPLTGLNRAFVAQGLKIMARRANAGLAALSDVASIDGSPTSYHAGFILGPRVNAGGRIGESALGARLLATEDREEALTIAHRLDELNDERRAIEAEVLAQAIEQAERAPRDLRRADDPGGARGMACGRDRHRREPARRPLQPAGCRHRSRGRPGQGLGPLDPRRQPGGCDHRGPPGWDPDRRRRPSHGRRAFRSKPPGSTSWVRFLRTG